MPINNTATAVVIGPVPGPHPIAGAVFPCERQASRHCGPLGLHWPGPPTREHSLETEHPSIMPISAVAIAVGTVEVSRGTCPTDRVVRPDRSGFIRSGGAGRPIGSPTSRHEHHMHAGNPGCDGRTRSSWSQARERGDGPFQPHLRHGVCCWQRFHEAVASGREPPPLDDASLGRISVCRPA
jgi:hypothetical protein